MGRVVILFVFIMGACGLLAQESQVYSVTTTYTPPENGFKMSIQFRYKFINCFGEVSLAITKDKDKTTPISYIYNGIEYSLSGLAVDVQKEMRTNIGLTDVKADLYHSTNRLGALTLGNVIDWDIGGCFGQTYHVTKMLGLSDAAYKEHVAELLLKNLYISSMSNRSYKIEGLLKEVEKQKGYDTKMSEAASLKSQGKYDAAKAAYKDALRLKPNDPTAISKLNELEAEMKEKANEVEADRAYEEGKKHESNGSLEAAKEAYDKAAQLHPDHPYAASKAKEMADKIAKAKEKLREIEKAHIDASNRSMNFVIEGTQTGSAAHGSATQETWMIGEMKLEMQLSSLSDEPVYQTRFYWKWHDYKYSDYPLYISVLKTDVEQISQLAKYPDLLARWNRLRPEYLELQVELSWEHGDKTIAREGKMVVRPATISTSGSWSSWSSPASCAWKELFPYCNYLDYNYFRELGVYDKMKECSGHYNDDNCQPKYCFKYSDKLDFYSDTYRKNYSATFKVNKALWNEDEVLAIIEEFHKREKLEKEEGMSAEDFWNTPENEETKEGGDEDFWNTPENDQTVAEKKRSDTYAANRRAVQSEIDKFPNYRKKYEALKNPCSISSHKDQQVIEEGKITLTGAVNSYFKDMGAQVAVSVNGEKFSTSNSSSSFSSTIILNEGWNKVLLDVQTKSFGVQDSIRIFYKKPPPLPCDQNTASGGSGRTVNEHGLGKESGTFYVSYNMNDAPDEMIIYSGPKERISSSKILYQTHGYVSGRNRIKINFKDIDTGIITVIMNGPSSGTAWDYQIECPD